MGKLELAIVALVLGLHPSTFPVICKGHRS
jgi:hypothetical protein